MRGNQDGAAAPRARGGQRGAARRAVGRRGGAPSLREGRLLYIAEGAKDDDRCGIGIHAEDVAVLRDATAWGRNQLGHARMLVAEWAAEEVAGRLAGNV